MLLSSGKRKAESKRISPAGLFVLLRDGGGSFFKHNSRLTGCEIDGKAF